MSMINRIIVSCDLCQQRTVSPFCGIFILKNLLPGEKLYNQIQDDSISVFVMEQSSNFQLQKTSL